MAYAARPGQPNGRGMVILPDVRGLFDFYKELAVRFAEAGFEAVTLDYYSRVALEDDRSDAFDWQTHNPQVTPEMNALDVRACVDHLRARAATAVFTVGFCYGGSVSWRQAGEGHGLAGAIGFYSFKPLERVGPWVTRMQAPILMLLAGADPPEEYVELAARIRAVGLDALSYTYAGAPHSFFDRRYAENSSACDDAWKRISDFTAAHSSVSPLG